MAMCRQRLVDCLHLTIRRDTVHCPLCESWRRGNIHLECENFPGRPPIHVTSILHRGETSQPKFPSIDMDWTPRGQRCHFWALKNWTLGLCGTGICGRNFDPSFSFLATNSPGTRRLFLKKMPVCETFAPKRPSQVGFLFSLEHWHGKGRPLQL